MNSILFLINEHDGVSFDLQALDIAVALRRLGFTTYVYSLKNHGSMESVFRQRMGKSFFVSAGNVMADIATIAKLIREKNIRVVQTPALRSDVVAFIAIRLAHSHRPAQIAVRHNYLFREGTLYHAAKNILYAASCRLVDVNVAVAPHIRDGLMRLGVSSSLIVNGVADYLPPIDAARIRRRFGISRNVPVVLFTGVFTARKNLLELMSALVRVTKPYICLLVGEGPEKPAVQTYISAHGLSGRVVVSPAQDTRPLYAAADIFVLPSLDEGMSLSLLEAMHAGLPCVVSDIRANADVVRNGIDGYIYPSGKPEKLAEALTTLLGSAALRKRKGAAARRRATAKFGKAAMMRSYAELYASVISPRRREL